MLYPCSTLPCLHATPPNCALLDHRYSLRCLTSRYSYHASPCITVTLLCITFPLRHHCNTSQDRATLHPTRHRPYVALPNYAQQCFAYAVPYPYSFKILAIFLSLPRIFGCMARGCVTGIVIVAGSGSRSIATVCHGHGNGYPQINSG